MYKLGLLSLESSHVDYFCRCFNKPDDADYYLGGAQVTALCPWGNPQERVDMLREQFGISEVYETAEEMVPAVDAALALARDGDVHLQQALPFLEAGKPVFVDKPFACNLEDAQRMLKVAREHGAPIMSCSALRYGLELQEADFSVVGELRHLVLIGPGELFFYGIHMTELLNTIMGGGVAAVSNLRERSFDLITATYGDGRSATLHILRGGAKAPFSVQAIGTGGQLRFEIGNVLFYRETMRRFLEMLQTGVQPIAYEDIYETIALLVAADQSARTGRSVRLAELVPYETPFSSVWRSHG